MAFGRPRPLLICLSKNDIQPCEWDFYKEAGFSHTNEANSENNVSTTGNFPLGRVGNMVLSKGERGAGSLIYCMTLRDLPLGSTVFSRAYAYMGADFGSTSSITDSV